MATDYGIDIDMVDDMPLKATFASGARNVGNALARRLMTPHGALTAIDPEYGADYGYDLRALLNAGFTPARENEARAFIVAECLKDARVESVKVAFALVEPDLAVTLEVTLVEGQVFDLVLQVSALTVAVLRNA